MDNDENKKHYRSIPVFLFIIVLTISIPYFGIKLLHKHGDKRKTKLHFSLKLHGMYTAAQAYFTDYPNGTVNLEKLKSYGFQPSTKKPEEETEIFKVIDGTRENLTLTGYKPELSVSFKMNHDGRKEEIPVE